MEDMGARVWYYARFTSYPPYFPTMRDLPCEVFAACLYLDAAYSATRPGDPGGADSPVEQFEQLTQ